MNFKNKVIFVFGLLLLFGIGLKKINDYQDYNPTVIVETYKYSKQENKELFKGDIVADEFRATNNNLGIISLLFTTHNKSNDDYLQFSIREKGQKDWYYTNKYKVDQFQDYQYFPFGFPEIRNSKGKIYQIQIESLLGKQDNSVGIIRNSKPFLSKYGFSLSYLKQNTKEIPLFILGKSRSYFDHIDLRIYLFVLIASLLLHLINIDKLLKNVKKIKGIDERKGGLICVLALFITNLLINGPIRLKALAYYDDLYYWIFFNKSNFFVFIFNTLSNKFRPIFNLVYYLLFVLIGNRIWLFGIFLLFFNFLISVLLYHLFYKISKNIIVSFCLSIAYLVSSFSYYNITQAAGLMEAMALLLSVLLLYWLWCYLNTDKLKYFWISMVMFLLVLLTHERFVTLLLLYFVVLFLSKINFKKILLFLVSILPVVLVWCLKVCVFHTRPFEGTGTSNILETFSISGFVQLFISGCLYLFKVNAGPSSLNGISSEAVPQSINILILAGYICLLLIFIFFIFTVYKKFKNILNDYTKNFILFFAFIILTLIAGSVTIRLEMRWLYVPFVGVLFLIAYMFKIVKKNICVFLVLLWFCMMIPAEMLYRSYYKNIYYWSLQTFGNSLYEETIKKYGNDFWNYNTNVICVDCKNNLNLDLNLFFSQYGNKKIDNLNNKKLELFYNEQQGKFLEK